MAAARGQLGAFEGRWLPCWRPSGLQWAHSSPGLAQKPSAHHPQIAQRKQRVQLRLVLGQAAIAQLHMSELTLDDPERMLHFRPDAGLHVLELVHERAHRRGLIQCAALARTHGHVPVGLDALGFFALAHALVARVGEHIALLPMHQPCGLRHVIHIGSRADDRMHQPRVGIHPNVRLHPEVPLIALLRLVHLGVAFTRTVLGRTGCGNQRGIDHRATLEHQALGRERGIDRGQQLQAQAVALQQMAKAQDGALVGQ
eukprot:14924-Eustigmatos_ZCMA.PRE.1